MVNLLPDIELSQPVFVEVEKGTTPKRVFGENLVFNSAAALYDYIHFDCERHHGAPMGHSVIQKAKLLERFEKYLAEKHYYWPQVIRDWMDRNLTQTLVTEFNRDCLPRRCFFGVNVYVPVLFINGPIHSLVESAKKSTQFERRDLIVTRVRVPGWPAKLRRDLLGYTAEAPLLITNEDGISQLLIACNDGFLALEKILKRARSTFAERWPIEAAFYQMALERLLTEDDSSVRSDLDFFQWLHPISYESG